jgi:hypothetical protein
LIERHVDTLIHCFYNHLRFLQTTDSYLPMSKPSLGSTPTITNDAFKKKAKEKKGGFRR